MALFLFYDGAWLPEGQPLVGAQSRGFRYGDGLFETLYVRDGAIRLARYHFERLLEGMRLLELRLPENYDTAWLADRVAALCKKNGHSPARVRLTVFRGEGALFDGPGAPAHYLIESQPLTVAPLVPNQGGTGSTPDSRLPTTDSGLPTPDPGLLTGIFPHARKAADAYSHCKTNNYLPSVLAALHARRQGWNDAVLLNAAGRVCESAIANLFIVSDGRVYTPPLSEGCVAGVVRRFLLEQLGAAGYAVEEKPVSVEALYAADEVFLTNALHPLRPVLRCDHVRYDTRLGMEIAQAIQKMDVDMWK